MAEPNENYLLVNGGIELDIVKIDTRTDLSFDQAIIEKEDRENHIPVLFNSFKQNLNANYNPPTELDALATITIYRKIPGQTYYDFVCFLPSGKISFYDFNIRNNEFYHYLAAIPVPVATGGIGTDISMEYKLYENMDLDGKEMFHKSYWKSWSITNIIESDTVEDTYEQYGYTWNLKCNIEGENITQNNAITSWDTLGRYPKISIGQKRYDSGTFTGLLGDVADYQTVIETRDEYGEITDKIKDSFSYTERFQNSMVFSKVIDPLTGLPENYIEVKYANEMEKLSQWKEFVNDGSLKLLKDLKGNSWIVQIIENPTYDIDNRPHSAPATISFNWQEVENINNTAVVNFD